MKRTSLQWIPLSLLGAIPSAAAAYHEADMSAPSEVAAMAAGVATIAVALVGLDDRLVVRGHSALRTCFVHAARVFVVVQLMATCVGLVGARTEAIAPLARVFFGAEFFVGALGLSLGDLAGRGLGATLVPASPGAVVAYVATVAVGSIWALALVAIAALARLALRFAQRARDLGA